jgi:cell division protein FtsQ
MAVQAPTDKRFRRAHVQPSRKTWRTWRWNWTTASRVAAVLVISLVVLYRVAALVLSAQALSIDRITISGNSRMSRGEIVTVLDGLRGKNMLAADLERWRLKLKGSPWVADAAIRRIFPNTVAVTILERDPIGIGRIHDDLYLIDRRGAVIDMFGPNYAELDLPIIDGLTSTSGRGVLIDEARAALATRLLEALSARRDLAARISEIDVSDEHDAVVMLKDDATVLRVGDDEFLNRLASYIDLAPALRERVADIDYVDMRFDDRIYVRPRSAR